MRKHIRIWIIICVCVYITGISQTEKKREKLWTIGFNVGTIGNSNATDPGYFQRIHNFGIGALKSVNSNKRLAIIANTSIGLNGGVIIADKFKTTYTCFYAEFQKNKACYSFQEPFSYSFTRSTSRIWVDVDDYLKFSLGVIRTWHFRTAPTNSNSCWYAKISLGQTFYHRNFGIIQNTGYEKDLTENGTGFKLKVLVTHKHSWVTSPEIGRRIYLKNNRSLHIGVVYHASLAPTRTTEYNFFASGKFIGESQITYYGSTIMLNFGYSINRKIKDKPDQTKKIKLFDDLAIDSAELKHKDPKTNLRKINGRRFHIQQTVNVTNNSITLLVWDKNKVDGDEISLYLNGTLILENYTVSKTKKEIKVQLQPGTNIIVMHALNLGKIPPNTAALSVSDGSKKKKTITLVSDLHKSGAVEIIYNP